MDETRFSGSGGKMPESEQNTQSGQHDLLDAGQGEKSKRSLIAQVWTGDVPLKITYWGFCFMGNMGLAAVWNQFSTTLKHTVNPSSTWMFAGFGLMLLTTVYSLWILVGVWRSAGKYEGKKVWSILARIVVIIGISRTITSILSFWELG